MLLSAFLFAWSTICPLGFAETIHLEGGTVDVNVQDRITSVGVTGNPVWNLPEFNIAQGSTYNLTGLSAGASLAMLVNGGQASNIFGTLNLRDLAFILQNIAGIHIGSTGLINLNNASFIASTIPMNLSMTNFLAQQYQFSGQGGFLSNEGRILGGKGDLVALVANAIENKGTIEVPMGTVALAAGKTVTIGLSGDGLISVGVDEATANAMGLKDQIKNTGTIQANGGRVVLDAKAVDGLFEKAIHIQRSDKAVSAIQADNGTIEFKSIDDIYNDAIVQAMQGEIKITSEAGAITNTGSMDASKGRIEMSAKGDIETMGNLEAAYFREKAAAFRIGGDYHVGQSFHDNLDNAITYSANANVSGTINDVANIVINAGVTLTMTDDTTFDTDSDANGTGAFLMDATAEIVGGGYDLHLYAGEGSTIGKINGVRDMSLNTHSGDTVTYQVRNAVTMTGDLRINSGVTLTGGYSVTVGGGDVTGDGVINMSGGTFTVTGSGNFGGSQAWTFGTLQFGDGTTEGTTSKTGTNKITALDELKISLKHTLGAGSSTWDLSWGGGYLSDVIKIVAGAYHSLALLGDGTVKAWGYNGSGRLGDGTTEDRLTPVAVSNLSGVSNIAAGYDHSLALLSDGTIKSWGSNYNGQLGDGSRTDRWTPGAVLTVAGNPLSALSGVAAIAAGAYYSMALLSNGTVKSWGGNSYGQLGDGSLTRRLLPVNVSGLSGVISIAAGTNHSLALLNNNTPDDTSDDYVKSWGLNNVGQLGDGSLAMIRLTPVTVSNLSGVTSIAAGFDHSLALLSDGTVKSWGYNYYGQLGNGTQTNSNVPVAVSGLSEVSSIAAGTYFSLALLSNGTVKSWGFNGYDGLLGDGTTTTRLTPVTVSNLSGVSSISAGGSHSLTLLSDGTVKSWGNNSYGQLGTNSATSSGLADYVLAGLATVSLTDISQIAAGLYHTLALKSDGSRVYAWGDNTNGELGNGTVKNAITPVEVLVLNEGETSYLSGVSSIAAGAYFSLAVLSNGTTDTSDDTVKSWGANWNGQLGDGTTTSRSLPVAVVDLVGVKSVAAGGVHSLALLTDGTVKSWGFNGHGQLGDGTTQDRLRPVTVSNLSGVSSIAAGYYHSLALLSNGTVKSWGLNDNGQLGDGTYTRRLLPGDVSGLSGVVSIAAGAFHSLALLPDDTVKSWGYNLYGQLGNGDVMDSNVPVLVANLTGVSNIAAGAYHSLALLSNGTAKAWGCNQIPSGWLENGQLGDGTTTNRPTPVTVSGLSGGSNVAAGGYHSLSLRSNGALKSWGSNNYGQLGDNSITTRLTPVDVQILSHAPFTIARDSDHPENNAVFNPQNSTFMYTGSYAFSNVVVTEVANTTYNNLVLKSTLDNYVLQTDPSRAAKTPTEQDLYDMIMPGGSLTLLGEQKTLPKIDLEAAQKALAERDAAARAFEAMMRARMGDRTLTLDFFSQFFNPSTAINRMTVVNVREGAVVVYPLDGGSDASLLTQGESLSVPFKEKKAALARPGQKEPEEKLVSPAPESPMVTGGNQPEASPREELLFGTHKPAPPVVAGHDEGAGRYATLKNPGKDVFVQCPGGEWQSAKDGMVIMPGDVVKTAETGSVEVMLDGGKVGRVEIKEGSLFRIRKAETDPTTGDKTTLLELAIGKLIAHVEKLQGKSKFEVKSPTALTGVRGTVFEVTVREKDMGGSNE